MTLASKGNRIITVDDVEYRWLIRKKPTYCQGAFASPMKFAVEIVKNSGQTLLVDTEIPRPDNWLERPSSSITPRHVFMAIRQALNMGWDPCEPGPAFTMKFDLKECQQVSFTIRRLREEDCALIGPLLRRVWLYAYDGIQTEEELLTQSFKVHTADQIRCEITDPNTYSVVAEVDGEVIGHARSDCVNGVVNITRLYVLREFYGRGIGKALLAEVDSFFDPNLEVWLEVFEDNKRAVDFYLSQNYEIMERATEVQSEGKDVFEFKMRKKVVNPS